MGSISDGIDNLCLDDDVDLSSVSVNTLLGAIPKANHVTTNKPSTAADLASPMEPPASKKQQRKKNRKDRRRSDVDSGGDSAGSKPPQSMSKVEKLRAAGGGGAHSKSERRPAPLVTTDVPSILFKSNSSISVNTGIKNLPDSFFSDRLPEEIEEKEIREKSDKDQKKRKRKKPKRKQTSTEEDDEKQVSEREHIEDDTLNDKLIDDDPGEEIITHYGDEQCVVSKFMICYIFDYFLIPQYNWRNVTRNGDIKKCILVEGTKEGGRPKNGDVVLVKSQGKLKDGAMIDDYPTLVFRVGEYEVIEGLDLVVQVNCFTIYEYLNCKPIPYLYQRAINYSVKLMVIEKAFSYCLYTSYILYFSPCIRMSWPSCLSNPAWRTAVRAGSPTFPLTPGSHTSSGCCILRNRRISVR